MPRLPEILDREQLPEAQRDLFDYLAGTRGSVRIPFSIVMHSPEAARRISHLGTYLRFESTIPRTISEMAICATAREFDCHHEFVAHARLARENGVADSTIEVIGRRGPLDDLPEEARLPVSFARGLLRDHELDDATFEAARERYGEAGVIDLMATIGYYGMMACLLNGLQIIPPDPANRLPSLE